MTTIDENLELAVDKNILKTVTENHCNVPNYNTKIFKDECMYCFHTPYFEGGLFICLKTYCAFCPRHLAEYAPRTDSVAFVQTVSRKVPFERDSEPEQKISRLAVGVEGGFCNEKFDIVDDYYFVVYPYLNKRMAIGAALGAGLYASCNKVVTTTSAERLEMLQNASNAWDGELKQVTKHADLTQLPNGKMIPSNGWTCEEDGCDLQENLWLNLTDGAIRCGRSQFISEGEKSKGNNHMKQYYDTTGLPLVVKLGTIEKDGTADVFSYDEDDAVIDPNLRKHLAHFGLDIDTLEKTEKSTMELEMDMNQKWEWSRIQEDGANLENAFGPGYTGLINIGSSCYVNSVLQAFLLLPEFTARFGGEKGTEALHALPPADVFKDFNAQLARLVQGMLGGDYALPDGVHNGIKPTQFKRIAGAGHPEFSTAKQQDAEEYVRYIIEKISAKTAAGEIDPTVALKFKTEIRFEDVASGRVRYSDREEVLLPLPIPKAAMRRIPEQDGRFTVRFEDCLTAAFEPQPIDGFTSPITGEQKGATNTMRMKTFSDFLFVQMQKFAVDETTFTVKKLDVDVEVPDELDLDVFRSTGLQEGEKELPEDAPMEVPKKVEVVDETVVEELVAMGFTWNAAMKASLETKNGGLEAAADWIMVRLDDPALNDPPAGPSQLAEPAEDSQSLVMLMDFGFTKEEARYGLKKFNFDANMAAEWLLQHRDEVPAEEQTPAPAQSRAPTDFRDGSGRYRLVGFISHMGSSPHSGHYVAHLKKGDRWVLFNDEKVAFSQNPPKQLAYLYLYQRA